jgi:hypothetical protein
MSGYFRTRNIGVLDMKFIVFFSLIVISRSNSDNSAYSWSVPEKNHVFYNVTVLMPSKVCLCLRKWRSHRDGFESPRWHEYSNVGSCRQNCHCWIARSLWEKNNNTYYIHIYLFILRIHSGQRFQLPRGRVRNCRGTVCIDRAQNQQLTCAPQPCIPSPWIVCICPYLCGPVSELSAICASYGVDLRHAIDWLLIS